MSNKFIVVEGSEGVGKSSQIKIIERYLINNKIDYILTREPGGTSFGESIRDIILNDDNNTEEISSFWRDDINLSIPLKNDFTLNIVYSLFPEGELNSFNIKSLYTSNTSAITLESLGDFVDVDLNTLQIDENLIVTIK